MVFLVFKSKKLVLVLVGLVSLQVCCSCVTRWVLGNLGWTLWYLLMKFFLLLLKKCYMFLHLQGLREVKFSKVLIYVRHSIVIYELLHLNLLLLLLQSLCPAVIYDVYVLMLLFSSTCVHLSKLKGDGDMMIFNKDYCFNPMFVRSCMLLSS